MIIREAKIEDYADLHRINKDSLGYDYPVDKTRIKIEIILSLPTDKIFVAEIDNSAVGYIHLSVYECTYSDSLKNILAIAVTDAYQGMGVGRALLTAGENWARENGCCGIRLVSGFNREEAHRFYDACGYQLRKNQKNFIKWL